MGYRFGASPPTFGESQISREFATHETILVQLYRPFLEVSSVDNRGLIQVSHYALETVRSRRSTSSSD